VKLFRFPPLLAVALAVALPLAAARADIPPPGSGAARAPGWFVPAGLNVGGTAGLGARDSGLLLGAEISAVYLFGTPWAGIFADALYAFGEDRPRVAVGLEAGWFVFGVELGYTAELGPDGPAHGLRTGLVVTGGVLGAYVRWRHSPAIDGDDVEAGLLVKWPFQP
jgi:hypothetical protein